MNNWLLILMLLANMSQCSENGSAPNTSDAAMAAHEHFDEIVNSDIDTSWTEKVVKSKAEWKNPDCRSILYNQGAGHRETFFKSPQ